MSDQKTNREQVFGLVAEYDSVDGVMAAARKVRDAGYTHWDVHTPFPVHGLDGAMGVRPTVLPWLVLGGGLTGLGGATLMQWWMNAVDYKFLISGKPDWSLAANIPVMFESTILLSALTCFFAVLAMNGLPRLYNPLFRLDRFKRVTDDRFFVVVEARDPAFKESQTRALLESTGAAEVEVCMDEVGGGAVPRWLKTVAVIAVLLSFFPLAFAYRARTRPSEKPRFHLVFDMDSQPKLKPQTASPLFAGRASTQKPIEGTIPVGGLGGSLELEEGKTGPGPTDWATVSPVEVSLDLLQRGEQRFGIYCMPCHGVAGDGDGAVARRASLLNESGRATWTSPANFHDPRLRALAIGEIYNTIKHGKNTMKGYGRQIPVEDRWAIALYVRALQRTRDARIDDVPAELRDRIQMPDAK